MDKNTRSISSRARAPAFVLLAATVLVTLPAAGRQPERQGRAIVESVCSACHLSGKDGAPAIGDRAAWTPRLAKGLDTLVDIAILGHGGMPPRGGVPQLEREELRSAILYMFNHGLPAVTPPPEFVAKEDARHKVVANADVYLGVIRADAMRAAQGDANRRGLVQVKVPSGKDYYHLNISLAERNSGAAIHDAQVSLRVSDGLSVQEKVLKPVAANNAVSYGEFFRLASGSAYGISVEIRRPGAGAVVTNFEYRAP